MLDGMSDSIQGSRIENLQSREVDRQSPTGLIFYFCGFGCVIYVQSSLHVVVNFFVSVFYICCFVIVNMPVIYVLWSIRTRKGSVVHLCTKFEADRSIRQKLLTLSLLQHTHPL